MNLDQRRYGLRGVTRAYLPWVTYNFNKYRRVVEMKIREYLEKKYGRDTSLGLLACEAKVFGIHYPLQSGWLADFGDQEITRRQRDVLLAALRKSKSEHAPAGINVLVGIIDADPPRVSEQAAIDLSKLLDIGGQMANVMFNLSQWAGETLSARDAETMSRLRKEWDAARAATHQQAAPEAPAETFCDNNCVWTDHHPDCSVGVSTTASEQAQQDALKCSAEGVGRSVNQDEGGGMSASEGPLRPHRPTLALTYQRCYGSALLGKATTASQSDADKLLATRAEYDRQEGAARGTLMGKATTASTQEGLEEALACALSEYTNLSTDGIDDCVPRLVATIPPKALPFTVVPTEGIDPALYELATTASASGEAP